MKYAIRDVVREDGVIGTLVLEGMEPGQDIRKITTIPLHVISFEPTRARQGEDRVVLRDPEQNLEETMSFTDDSRLVCGVSDVARDRIFG